MNDHAKKLGEFVRLHHSAESFLMPNAWDAGTARILEGLGFKALATTSAGLAFALGLRDSTIVITDFWPFTVILSRKQTHSKWLAIE